MSKLIKKWKKIALAVLMVFTSISSALSPVMAVSVNKGEFIWYPDWLGHWNTSKFTIDGKVGYCLEASKDSPESGDYDEVVSSNMNLLKVLYYGYGGPVNTLESRGLTDDEQYVCTHVMASYAYSKDLKGADGWATARKIKGKTLKEVYEEIIKMDKPTNTFHFSKDNVKAYLDDKHQNQRTENITLNTSSKTSIIIPLPNDVTLHNITQGTSQTGKVTVKGGETFYLSAPLTVTGEYNSGNIAGKNLKMYAPLVIEFKDPEQDEGYLGMVDDPTKISLKVKWIQTGSIELTKVNTNNELIDGAVFRISNAQGYSKDVEVKNGKIKIDYLNSGTYKLQEIKAPDGYLLDDTVYTIEVKPGQTSTQTVVNGEPYGKIVLTKTINTSQVNQLKGDSFIEDNKYQLYAKDKITNKKGTVVFYEKDQLISTQKTDKNGQIEWDDLPIGNYYIKESQSNDSLVLNPNVIDVSIKYEGQTVEKALVEVATKDRVNMQKIQVFKSGEKDSMSGFVKGLQGAEFTFKLKSEVNHVGWDNAKTYAKITTDKNGRATTPYLPYGQYLVKETVTPKDYITAPDFLISVTDDYSEYTDIEQIKIVNINNRPFTSQVKIIKKDYDTDKTVTLNSASFKIKDEKGKYVIQKVMGVKIDTFTTNSQNQIVSLFGEDGEVVVPLQLDAGTYTIEEIKVPEGFLEMEEPVKFTITNQYDYDVDQDDDPMLEVIVKNRQPNGEIKLSKTDKENQKPLKDVEYELIAKEDIISAIDGTVLYKTGDIVSKGITDEAGQFTIGNLFMGHYELRETLTNEGYVLSTQVHDIVLRPKDTTTKLYTVDIHANNIAPHGEIHLTKTDRDSKELLSGVTYQLTAKEDIYSLDGRNTLIYKAGDPVSVDISENGYYVTNELGEIHIGNLPLGKYQMKEIQPLEGYVTNKHIYDIDLSFDGSDKTIYTHKMNVTNSQTTVKISKKNITNLEELEGAELTLFDKDNNIIETWLSTKEPHIIKGLKVGEEYRLHENLAPLGYVKSNDIIFTIEDTDKVQQVEMIDDITKVEISKQDITSSEELAGAKLQIIDKDGNIIREWITEDKPKRFDRLPIGEYILREISAPEGYEIAEDVKFLVKETGEIQKVVMKDMRITKTPLIVKTDDNSNMLMYGGITLVTGGLCYMLIRKKKLLKKGDESY